MKINIFWFRRDLRLEDNHALYKALKHEYPVLPIFIFDKKILDSISNKNDPRVDFIYQNLCFMNDSLKKIGKKIKFYHGYPLEIFKQLSLEYKINYVFANEDYEPSAIKRDVEVAKFLKSIDSDLLLYKDQVIFHKEDILKSDKKPYTVYTPYSNTWLKEFNKIELPNYPSEKLVNNFINFSSDNVSLQDLGFNDSYIIFPAYNIEKKIIKPYDENRNIPSKDTTTKLSLHLRFGTKSIREIISETKNLNPIFLKELIWREFFMQILYHFPKVVHQNFKEKYNGIIWKNKETDIQSWTEGKTGYPIVDAGMRELNETGFMHNRVRMITASFLIKHLLVDWRIGEAYFAEKLLDFELSSNNGNWQWVAGTGCDAAPYFRIFNPTEQQKKFDPHYEYIKKWVPEYGTNLYPKPIVDHKYARNRALETYNEGILK